MRVPWHERIYAFIVWVGMLPTLVVLAYLVAITKGSPVCERHEVTLNSGITVWYYRFKNNWFFWFRNLPAFLNVAQGHLRLQHAFEVLNH